MFPVYDVLQYITYTIKETSTVSMEAEVTYAYNENNRQSVKVKIIII